MRLAWLLAFLLMAPLGAALVQPGTGMAGDTEATSGGRGRNADATLESTGTRSAWSPGAMVAGPAADSARWLLTDPVRPAPGRKDIEFVCPKPHDNALEYVSSQMHVVYTCPIRIYDNTIGGNTGWLFGNMELALDPTDPQGLAFFTLHGSAVEDGPSPYSRYGLTHSIFSSTSSGIGWTDSWTGTDYPADGFLGEWASGTFDSGGNVYAAFTWNRPGGESIVRALKLPPVQSAREYMDLYNDGWFDAPLRGAGERIEHAHVLRVAADSGIPAPALANQSEEEFGDLAGNATAEESIVLVWHSVVGEGTNSTGAARPARVRDYAANAAGPRGYSGWIDMAWTHTGPSNTPEDWRTLPEDEVVGPCLESSDPVAWRGRVYVACVVAKGYEHRRGARIGDVDVWSFSPSGNKTRLEGHTRIAGDEPRLAVTPDGYFAIAASRVVAPQDIEVRVSMGWHGHTWQETGMGIGAQLHAAMGNHPVFSAQVTAIEVTQETKTAFLVYKEWNDVEAAPQVDPNDPTNVRLTAYRKFVATLDACEAPIAGAEFMLGTSPDVYQQQGFQTNQGAFDDRQDGLAVRRTDDGQELVYFVVSDYGAGLYGAMNGLSGASETICAAIGVPAAPLTTALPQAAAVGSPANMYVAAGTGMAAIAMVAYLLTVKRKNLLVTAAEDK